MRAGKRGLECGLTTLQALAYDIVTSSLMVKQVDPPPSPLHSPHLPVSCHQSLEDGCRNAKSGVRSNNTPSIGLQDPWRSSKSMASIFPPSPPPVSCHQSLEDGCRKARFGVRSNNTPSIGLQDPWRSSKSMASPLPTPHPPPYPPSPANSLEDGCRKARFGVRSNNTPSTGLRHTSSMVAYPLAFIF